jgi:phospholipid/cholesterol/gamma-HCH transport system substrate-binding protein
MKQNNIELSVGAFVLLGMVAIVWFAAETAAGVDVGGSTYSVTARFTNVGGLKPGSQVFVAGVPVGRVEQINLDSNYAAIVRMKLRQSIQLPSDTIASIKTSGLIGDKFVALSPGSDSKNLAPEAQITDTESAVDLESLISRFAFGNVTSTPAASPAAPK